jgi:hypothetical protein
MPWSSRRRSERACGPAHSLAHYSVKFLIVMAMLSRAAVAQSLFGGTFFVAAVQNDFVVVAIDSRASSEDAAPNDRHCKIQPLSRNVIFFATGLSYILDRKDKNVVLDAGKTAKNIFDQLNDRNFDLLSDNWAAKMKDDFTLLVQTPFETSGFFAGLDAAGNITFLQKEIEYRPMRGFAVSGDHTIPAANAQMLYSAGHDEIIRELISAQTARAKAILVDVERRAADRPAADAIAIRFAAYVAAVRDWSGDNHVGGEIAVIILEKRRGWHWYHRPDFCPEN